MKTAEACNLIEKALVYWFENHPDNDEAFEVSEAWKKIRLELLMHSSVF